MLHDNLGGTIYLWNGAIIDIPEHFVLCDGNNGTPDLRDKFIAGAGSTYNPGNSGGTVNHNHTFTGDGHTHSFNPPGPGAQATGPYGFEEVPGVAAGTTNSETNLPLYYSLAYIMRI